MDLWLLWRWCYLQNLVLSVNIGCRDNLPVTTYIIKDTVRYFFMIFFLRYTNWLVLPGKFILICNICSKYNVQIPPPPLPNTKHDISDNFKIFHLITFIEWWFYTHMLGTCVRVFISNDNENKSRDKEWESLVGIIILNIFPVDFNVKTNFFLLSITLL